MLGHEARIDALRALGGGLRGPRGSGRRWLAAPRARTPRETGDPRATRRRARPSRGARTRPWRRGTSAACSRVWPAAARGAVRQLRERGRERAMPGVRIGICRLAPVDVVVAADQEDRSSPSWRHGWSLVVTRAPRAHGCHPGPGLGDQRSRPCSGLAARLWSQDYALIAIAIVDAVHDDAHRACQRRQRTGRRAARRAPVRPRGSQRAGWRWWRRSAARRRRCASAAGSVDVVERSTTTPSQAPFALAEVRQVRHRPQQKPVKSAGSSEPCRRKRDK
jgi:hypothetical protein